MAMGGKDLKARVRHRGNLQGGTEILIDRLDQEKKLKVLHYLRANHMEPAAGEEDQLISVEVSAADSKKIGDRLVSYMRSIGLDDVSVSSAHFNRTRPEIEEESLLGHDYTLIGSEDVRELARRLEAGEESEFELIVSSIPDVASMPGGRRWRSSDVIRTITGSTRQNEADVLTVERNEQPNTATLDGQNTEQIQQSKKRKCWRRKALRLLSFFRRTKQEKAKNATAQTPSKEVKPVLEGNQLNSINKTQNSSNAGETRGPINKKNNYQSDNKNKTLNRLSDIRMKKLKPLKNVKKMAKEMKVSEAYTQTDCKRNRKFTSSQNQALSNEKVCKKSGTTNVSSSGDCCTCCSTDCTSATVHPQFITLTGQIDRNLPFYQPLWRQPFYYLCHQNPFPQMSNYKVRPPQEKILVESCNTFTQTTTSETTNTITCSTTSSSCTTRHERKMYKRKFQPKEGRKIKKNESRLGDESSMEDNFNQTDSSAQTWKKFTTFQSSKIMRNADEKKRYHSFHNKTSHRDFHKLNESCQTNNKNIFEKQLTELHEKIEEIALRIEAKRLDTIVKSFELSTKDKKPIETIDRGVECTGLDYIINYQNGLDSKNKLNSNNTAQETECTIESKDNEENFRNEEKSPNMKTEEVNDEPGDNSSEGNEHLVSKTQKISDEEKLEKNDRERRTRARSKKHIRREEHMRRGITWGQYPDGRYGYGQSYDHGLVVPVTTWGPDHSLGLRILQGEAASREHRKKRRSRCMKLCSFLMGDKTSNLREQLLQQKLDLMEMKTVLTAINHTIREEKIYSREQSDDISGSDEIYSEDDEESSEDYSSEENENKSENKENTKEDIQFSLSRPKISKKTVTFRTPLID